MVIPADDPRAVAAVEAIHTGDTERLRQLLADHPELVTAELRDPDRECGMTRTLLHVVTDWPGHYPDRRSHRRVARRRRSRC